MSISVFLSSLLLLCVYLCSIFLVAVRSRDPTTRVNVSYERHQKSEKQSVFLKKYRKLRKVTFKQFLHFKAIHTASMVETLTESTALLDGLLIYQTRQREFIKTDHAIIQTTTFLNRNKIQNSTL